MTSYWVISTGNVTIMSASEFTSNEAIFYNSEVPGASTVF